jgi:hypothetical protein
MGMGYINNYIVLHNILSSDLSISFDRGGFAFTSFPILIIESISFFDSFEKL